MPITCERQEGLPNPEAGRTAGYMYGMMFTVSDVRCLNSVIGHSVLCT